MSNKEIKETSNANIMPKFKIANDKPFDVNTKYKSYIAALELREEQYSNILDSMSEEVSREDPNGKVIYVNDAYCRFYGISREEAIGRKGTDVVIPEDRHKYDIIFQLSPENPVYKLDCRVKTSENKIARIQCTGKAFFDRNGKLIKLWLCKKDRRVLLC